jgi:predicted metal-dependent phosphoesterase TrpH
MAPKKKWIKFDLHMHSNQSDGKDSVEEMVKTASEIGLDVIAITDHNLANSFSVKKLAEKYGIEIISGCELSFLAGHFLVLGIEPKVIDQVLTKYKIKKGSSGNITRKKTIEKMFRFLKDKGALIIVAHPKIPSGMMSAKGNFLLELYCEGLIHGAEIHNGDLELKFKRKLYMVWHKLAQKFMFKFNIPAYSDTDAHSKSALGYRFNMVKLDDPKKLIDTLKKGKIKIKHGTKSDFT